MQSSFITEIKIEKVRHLENITIPLSKEKAKHLILTGKNGSGKTSVLEALAGYLQRYDVKLVPTIKSWERSRESYKNRLADLCQNNSTAAQEIFECKEQLKEAERILAPYFQGITVNMENFDAMLSKSSEGKFITAYYKAAREYRAQNEKHIEKVTLENYYSISDTPGEQLVKYLLDLKTTEALAKSAGKEERAKEISEWFDRFEGLLKEIFTDPDLYIDFDIETYAFSIIEKGKEPFSFDTLSSGYAAVLEIVSDLLMRMESKTKKFYDLEGIVLIDEIETHLHLELQKNILPLLISIFPNIQFIVTTHSPFILNSVANAVIYDLANHTLVNSEVGLANLPYEGIVEGYFNASLLAKELQNKYERYKILAAKNHLLEEDYAQLASLEMYLDEIPDYLSLNIMADYQKIKAELESRG